MRFCFDEGTNESLGMPFPFDFVAGSVLFVGKGTFVCVVDDGLAAVNVSF